MPATKVQCCHCGDTFILNHGNRKYCGRACSMRACNERRIADGRSKIRHRHERICEQCGRHWLTAKASARFCSNSCINKARYGPHPKRRGPMIERMKLARRAQRKAERGTTGKGIVWTQGFCGWCRDAFLARTSAGSPAAYCSKRCKHRAIHSRHNLRKRAAFVADVSPMAIFARDGYRCHICRRKTNKRKAVPHPKAPTIDHLIPVSLGGTHEPSNVATACFLCNSTKGNIGAGDQLALIG